MSDYQLTATDEQALLYDHENRLREIEGEPPLTMGEFLTKTKVAG